jgi:hypothetical protein
MEFGDPRWVPNQRGRLAPGALYFWRVSRESEVASNEIRAPAGVLTNRCSGEVASGARRDAASLRQSAGALPRRSRKLRRRRSDPRRRYFAPDVRESNRPNRWMTAARETPADAATVSSPLEAQFSRR